MLLPLVIRRESLSIILMKSKFFFDFFFAFALLFLLSWFLLFCIIISSFDTQTFGVFKQVRIGHSGIPFNIYKLKTIHPTTRSISKIGRFFRKTKLDELPQLLNILLGSMSFVGPRPDLKGYADELSGYDRIVLTVKPGVTGLASLFYRNEEQLLSFQSNPLHYNDTVIWPKKVQINKWYVENRSMWMDFQILFYTIFPVAFNLEKFISKKSS